MNVYVESNFILELALLQEQYESCERILTICEAGKAHLVLPAFCIAVIPLARKILTSAIGYQTTFDLSTPDSIVYASVIDHLSATSVAKKCFLNRDSKDFDDPDIVETLNRYGCKMIPMFNQGYGYIQNQIHPLAED